MFEVRRVVTGFAAGGRSVFVSDGVPPRRGGGGGFAFAELWHVPPPPITPESGGDPPEGPMELEPPLGGVTWKVLRIPASGAHASPPREVLERDPRYDASRPGMHRTDTIDFITVLEGRIELELDKEAVQLGPGDSVVQRGTWHRWKVLGQAPCAFSAVMLRSVAGGDPRHEGPGSRASASPTGVGPRRVVTHLRGDGQSVFTTDGEPPNALALRHGGGMAFVDLWQTLGPVRSPAAGGDAPPAATQLDPIGGGIAWKRVVIPPASELARLDGAKLAAEMRERAPGMGSGGHHDPAQPGRHYTDSIDLVQILQGEITLTLDGDSRDLRAGDCVVQRGTWHTWTNRGRVPCVFHAVMIGTQPLAR